MPKLSSLIALMENTDESLLYRRGGPTLGRTLPRRSGSAAVGRPPTGAASMREKFHTGRFDFTISFFLASTIKITGVSRIFTGVGEEKRRMRPNNGL